MIVYKVVSWNKKVNAYISVCSTGDTYRLKYNIGEITKAIDGTLGVFCFDNFDKAKSFVLSCLLYFDSIKILEVEGTGEGVVPKRIAINGTDLYIKEFYKAKFSLKVSPVSGTICYPAVRVIRKIRDFMRIEVAR